MKKLSFIVIVISCSLLNVIAQTPFGQFQLAIGGAGEDYAYSVKGTSDGGFAAAGGTTSFGNGDFYIVKLDAAGTLQWNRTVGGTGYEGAFFIIQTSDGGYAIAGSTSSFGAGSDDFYIVKLDAAGNLQWNRTLGGTGEDVAFAIIQSTDGGYAAAGYTSSFGAGSRDFYIVKLDSAGNLQWNKTAGGTNYEFCETIIQTSDGGFAAAGFTYSFGAGSGDFYIVKLDAAGTLQWSKTIGGSEDDYCLSIIQTTDGGYAVAGPSSSFGAGGNDFYIVKLNAGISIQWTRSVGGPELDYAESVIQTTDGGFVAAGLTYSFGAGNKDMYVVKLDTVGNLQWNRTVGGGYFDYAESIIQAADGGYAAAGHTNSFGAGNYDAYIVKLDPGGNTCGNTTTPMPLTSSGGVIGNPASVITSPNPLITTPFASTGTGGLLTTVCLVGIQPISNEIPALYSLYQNYPNPFNPVTKIRFDIPSVWAQFIEPIQLVVYDILGREVTTLVNEQLSPGIYEVAWDATNYPSGVYYYRLQSDRYTETKKMILLK